MTYAPPANLPSFAPAKLSPHFRRLLGDVQAARDLAAAWAMDVGSGGGAVGLAEGLRRDAAGAKAVAILRRCAGPEGVRPIVLGRQAALELGIAVPTLYMAADLVWDHPAWRDGAAPTGELRLPVGRRLGRVAASPTGPAARSSAGVGEPHLDGLDGDGRPARRVVDRLRRPLPPGGGRRRRVRPVGDGEDRNRRRRHRPRRAVAARRSRPRRVRPGRLDDDDRNRPAAVAGICLRLRPRAARLRPARQIKALIRRGLDYQYSRLPNGTERTSAPTPTQTRCRPSGCSASAIPSGRGCR